MAVIPSGIGAGLGGIGGLPAGLGGAGVLGGGGAAAGAAAGGGGGFLSGLGGMGGMFGELGGMGGLDKLLAILSTVKVQAGGFSFAGPLSDPNAMLNRQLLQRLFPGRGADDANSATTVEDESGVRTIPGTASVMGSGMGPLQVNSSPLLDPSRSLNPFRGGAPSGLNAPMLGGFGLSPFGR